MLKNKADLMQWPVTLLLLIFPVIALVIHDAGNAILFLLLMLSVVALTLRWQPSDGLHFGELLKSYWPLYLAMMSACLSVLLSQIWHGSFAIKFYDRGLRLAVFPLIFWLMFFVPSKYLKMLQWSFLIATVVATVKAYIFTQGGHIREGNIGYLSIIAYSDITLLTGMLCLTTIGWNEPNRKWITVLKMLVCVGGISTPMLTATRGSLLAIPLFLAFFFSTTSIRFKNKCMYAGIIIATIALLFLFNDAARSRFLSTQTDLAQYSQVAGKETSTGIRLQLWGAALKLFSREPVFGIGRENYAPAIEDMVQRKEVTRDLIELAHSHNEILFNMVISGVFGLISILALYLVPGYFFAKELKHHSPSVQTAARMGGVLVIGFFAFGLTDLMFFWPTIGGYYSLMLAAILVYIIKEKRAVSALSSQA